MYALRRVPRSGVRFAQIRGNATLEATSAEAAKPPPPPPTQQKAQTASVNPAPRPAASKDSETKGKPAEETAETPDASTKRRRRVQWPTSRPSITLERPRTYARPIGVGVLPAYDNALEYIKKDSERLKRELSGVNAELKKAQAASEPNAEEVERLKEKVCILEIQSEVNLPSVRWKARNGLGT